MLINSDTSLEFVRISWSVIIPAVVCTVLFFVFAIGMGIRAQLRKPVTGQEGLVGQIGEALTEISPSATTAQVLVHGERWAARSEQGSIPAGARVQVVRVEGLTVFVKSS
jgi:membrane-bound serine protease (ClpP class)